MPPDPRTSRPVAATFWVCVTAAVELNVVLPVVVRPAVLTVSISNSELLVRLTTLVLPAIFLMSLPVLVSV